MFHKIFAFLALSFLLQGCTTPPPGEVIMLPPDKAAHG